MNLEQLMEVNQDQLINQPRHDLIFRNPIKSELFRRKKSGKLKKIWEDLCYNGITNVGKNSLLDVYFNSGTQITTWYCGIIDNASFSALAAADTMSSHAGWIEFTTYSQANRVTWGSGAASSQSVTNGTAMQFDITGSATLNGIFIASNNTKSGTSGTLWATGSYSSTVPVTSSDVLKNTYTISC